MDAFCPNCGSTVQHLTGSQPPAVMYGTGATAAPALVATGLVEEEKGRRVIAYLIDVLPAFILGLLTAIPVLGILFAVLDILYWLLRDINGASLGKMAMGSVVMSADGTPSTSGQRIMRNLILAAPAVLALIPLVGWLVALPLWSAVFIVEGVMLLATGRRIGDHMGGTVVMRRSAAVAVAAR